MKIGDARKLGLRGLAFLAGVAVIYHEVVMVEQSEPLLIFLGMWLLGIPPALFLDGLRKVTDAANQAVDEVTARVEAAVPQVPGTEEPPPEEGAAQ